jgi:low molecular weight phosphotyrosine protein phosphatase
LILGFDNDNIRNLQRIKPEGSRAQIKLVNYFNEKAKNREIEDPWYPDTVDAFEKVFQDCHDSCLGILSEYK